jgi:hypothetical protein
MKHLAITAFTLIAAISMAPVVADAPAADSALTDADTNSNEACAKLMPETLRSQVVKDYAGFRFIRVDDYTEEDIKTESQYHHGSKCIAAASADYFGDKRPSFAFMLISGDGNLLVIVARENPGHPWKITKLDGWKVRDVFIEGEQIHYYLNTLEPGDYTNALVEEGEEEPPSDELKNLSSKRPGIVYGTIESTGVGYFFVDGHWVHLTTSD